VAQAPDDTCQDPAQGAPPAHTASSSPPPLVARQRSVKLGDTLQGNAYPVLQGIKPGDRLIVSGVMNLADCAPIAPQ
jgi:hypothetical protein